MLILINVRRELKMTAFLIVFLEIKKQIFFSTSGEREIVPDRLQ
jgi:hypothetical protein